MKKKLRYLLTAIAMLASQILPISNVFAAQPPTPDYANIPIGGSISITEVSNATSATAIYTNGTLTISGTGLYVDGTTVYSPAGNDVTLSLSPNASYTGDIRVNGTLVGAASYTLSNLAANSVSNVEAEFSQTTTQATINYTYGGNGGANISIEGTPFFDPGDNENPGSYSGTVNYVPTSATDVTFSIEPLFIKRLTALTINGTDCTAAPNFPNTPAKVMEATGNQVIHYTCTVAVAANNTYNISTTTTENRDEWMTVGNFLWSYLPQDAGSDDYVGHGRLTFVKIEYNGHEYTEAQMAALHKGYMAWGEFNEGNEGGALLPAGARVTVKLIPDVGYQLTAFTLNGQPFTAQEEIGTYEFEIPRGNFHLGAHFTKVNDAVEAGGADAVTSGSITLGGNEFDNGTARLEVKNAVDVSPDTIEGFETNSGDYNLKTILDIKLFNTIYKGTADESWNTQLDELGHEATITLKLDPSVDGDEVIIVHQKHDGTYEVIPTTYDPVNHTITFKTSSFSNYAIATKTVKTVGSPNTGFGPAGASIIEGTDPIIAVISMLTLWGFLAFVAKKGLAND